MKKTSAYSKLYNSRVNNKKCVRCNGDLDSARRKCQACRSDESVWRKNTRQNRADTERKYQQKHWDRRCVMHSKCSDRKYNRELQEGEDYITPKRLRLLRKLQMNKCYYCETVLQVLDRRKADGLSIERLNNNYPHSSSNCILACHSCNCKRKNSTNGKTALQTFYEIFNNYQDEVVV